MSNEMFLLSFSAACVAILLMGKTSLARRAVTGAALDQPKPVESLRNNSTRPAREVTTERAPLKKLIL
jgi:hypothetical protein